MRERHPIGKESGLKGEKSLAKRRLAKGGHGLGYLKNKREENKQREGLFSFLFRKERVLKAWHEEERAESKQKREKRSQFEEEKEGGGLYWVKPESFRCLFSSYFVFFLFCLILLSKVVYSML